MPLPVSVLMPVPHDHAYFLMPLSVCQAWRTLFSLANTGFPVLRNPYDIY